MNAKGLPPSLHVSVHNQSTIPICYWWKMLISISSRTIVSPPILRGVQMNIADFITSFISLLGVGTWVRQQKIHQFIAANLVLFDTTCGYLLSHWKYLQRYPRWCQNFIWCVIYRDDSWIWSTCVGRTKYQQNLQNCKNYFLTSFGVVRRSLSFERTIFPFRSHNLKDGWWRFCVQVVRKSKS